MDQGGPKREFFRILACEAAEEYMVGAESFKFITSNISALQV